MWAVCSLLVDLSQELVGLFNAFGGLAAALEGEAIYVDRFAKFSIYTGQGLSKYDHPSRHSLRAQTDECSVA